MILEECPGCSFVKNRPALQSLRHMTDEDTVTLFKDRLDCQHLIICQSWLKLPALPVQHGSRRGVVFSALITNQCGRDFMSSLHGTFWFTPVILFTHTDLPASESGFSSEDIYTTARNSPHTWCVLKSSALCM